MPAPLDFDALREIAGNRGLRLVRSRRRKPGAGDYGKLGVTIARAPRLLGFCDHGLTATPEEVAAYLRGDENSTRAASVRATPARPAEKAERRAPEAREPPAAKTCRGAARGVEHRGAENQVTAARPASAEKPAAQTRAARKGSQQSSHGP
jgi:hypothetical protein